MPEQRHESPAAKWHYSAYLANEVKEMGDQLQTALSALRKIGWYDSGNPTNGWQGELAREILVKLRNVHG